MIEQIPNKHTKLSLHKNFELNLQALQFIIKHFVHKQVLRWVESHANERYFDNELSCSLANDPYVYDILIIIETLFVPHAHRTLPLFHCVSSSPLSSDIKFSSHFHTFSIIFLVRILALGQV